MSLDVDGEQRLVLDIEITRETDFFEYAIELEVDVKHGCVFGGGEFLVDEFELDGASVASV